MRRSLCCVALSIATVLATPACFTRSLGDPNAPAELSSKVVTLPFNLHASGSETATFEGSSLPLTIRKMEDSRLPHHIFILEVKDPIPQANDVSVRAGLVLIDYTGDGRYTIGSAEGPNLNIPSGNPGAALQQGAASFSNGWFDFRIGNPPRIGRHYQAGVCVVDIRKGGSAGKMRCGRLGLSGGARAVALTITWGK